MRGCDQANFVAAYTKGGEFPDLVNERKRVPQLNEVDFDDRVASGGQG